MTGAIAVADAVFADKREGVSTAKRSFLPGWLAPFAGWAAGAFYRLKVLGAGRLPAGGAVIAANRLSYVDGLVLQLACRRPIRFVAFEGPEAAPFLGWMGRLSGVIRISSAAPLSGIREAVKAAARGELVGIFPEGGISRTGQLMAFGRAYALVARRAKVPVVPAAIDGLWGSIFSFAGSKYLWKSPRLMPTPVCVAFGEPIAPERAGSATRQAIMDLGAQAFEERPVLSRHLGREVIRSLARRPGSVCVVDRTSGSRSITAAQLIAVSAVLGRRLRSSVSEKRIGVVLPPGGGALMANLSILCAGKVPVNLNFTAGRAAVESSLAVSGIRTVVTAGAFKGEDPWISLARIEPGPLTELSEAGGKRAIIPWLLAAWILPNQWVAGLMGLPKAGDREEAALLFTSGSSGEPKGVVLTHRNILANCAQISSLSILPPTATMLGCLPQFHSFGFTATCWYPILRGCRLVTIPSPLDTKKMIDAIREEQVSVLVAAPTFVRPLLKKAQPSDLCSLDLVVTGAEKLSDELRNRFSERFHVEILEGYGLTETSPVSNLNQPDPGSVGDAEPQVARKKGTVGRLLPGMSARIVDPDTGRELDLTEEGMLWLRGPNIFAGYLNDPERSRAVLRDGWLVTGDVGRFDEEGFLTIAGRLSRFSKIAGEMVPHGTVEQKIVEAFDLDQTDEIKVVVVGIADDAKGEALALLSTVEITAEQVRQKLAGAGSRTCGSRSASSGFRRCRPWVLENLTLQPANGSQPVSMPEVIDSHVHLYPAEVSAGSCRLGGGMGASPGGSPVSRPPAENPSKAGPILSGSLRIWIMPASSDACFLDGTGSARKPVHGTMRGMRS